MGYYKFHIDLYNGILVRPNKGRTKKMEIKIDGLEETLETCPIGDICHSPTPCSDWERKNYEGCPVFRYNIGKPKIIAYVVNKVAERRTRWQLK